MTVEMLQAPVSDEVAQIDAYWRAANYLSAGQIYLLDNPLLRAPLTQQDVKPRLLGHWGTAPGLNFVYAHMNRVINRYDLNAIFVCGPGHGAAALVANAFMEGTYTERYPSVSQDETGLRKLFKQFSFPGGIPSHASPGTPGSINEGGELGYSIAHAFGAVLDNPDLIACCVVGDGEAETGALAASWHSNKFLNPRTDGAVLPVLHLNGYKIAGPTVLARIDEDELLRLFEGYGYEPILVQGHEPALVHARMMDAMDRAVETILRSQHAARADGSQTRPRWPMIVLRTPKGWTGPQFVDGIPVEGTFRAHQLPVTGVYENAMHRQILEDWMRSYRPEELFGAAGTLRENIAALSPTGERRMSANPHANGGVLLRELVLPDIGAYAEPVARPGVTQAESTRVLGGFLRDVMRANGDRFRVFGPDETSSNRLDALFEVTARTSMAHIAPDDENVAPDGRVMEVLSEHLCQGWLEGYLLSGRHGFFSCYEAFAHIVDSMFNQHAKWLETARPIPWRRPVASLNYLLTSHVWRQDHNGFSHQDPGFIDNVVNKKSSVVRVYLPPDANTLLCVADHCLRSRDYVNVIVAGKQPELQWLDMDAAIRHCAQGASIWQWASNDEGTIPDIVMACAGDVPTLETLAAVHILHQRIPEMRIRVVNVVDLLSLQPQSAHPHGLSDADFDSLFTRNSPVLFAFHGYPWLVHRLTYRRTNHHNFHVRGYLEEGTTTTPFDMAVRNRLDRLHLACSAIDIVDRFQTKAAHVKQDLHDLLARHEQYICERGEDLPEIRDWKWGI